MAEGKWKTVLLFVMTIIIICLSFGLPKIAVAEDSATLLYAIPSISNTYEQTLNTFTLSYCYPAQLLNQAPTITDGQEDPNGLTWVIFVPEHGDVQLTGKDSHGKWKCATWSKVDSPEMMFICYCLCKAFGSVYKDNMDFAICLYSDSGTHSYIANKASADSFIQMIDNEYGNTASQEEIDRGKSTGDGMKTYSSKDPFISMDFPEQFNVFWKNMPADDTAFYVTGLSVDDWDRFCSEDPGIVFWAVTVDGEKEYLMSRDSIAKHLDFSLYDDEMIKRYIGSVYEAQSRETGTENSAYKIIRTDFGCYVVSSEFIPSIEKPYCFFAKSAMGNHIINLAYSSNKALTKEDESFFLNTLRSISFEGKKQTHVTETDWFSVEDIEPYKVNFGQLTINVPANYMYYDKTNKKDLCLLTKGFSMSYLDTLLQQAGNGTDIYITDYKEDRKIMLKKQYISDVYNIDSTNQWTFAKQLAEMLLSSEESPGISLLNYDTLTSKGIDDPNALLPTLYRIYWAKLKLRNTQYGVDLLMYTTVIRNYQYTITLDMKSIDDDDEKEIDSIVSSILKNTSVY